MLIEDKIIAIFCLVDDMLKSIQHTEDKRRRVHDSEIITTALVSAIYFGGHQQHAVRFMHNKGMIPDMLSESRFCRRVHAVNQLLCSMILSVGKYLNEFGCEMDYVLDSFPVAVCDNIRIRRSKMIRGKKWRGYCASMRRYFYGVKVQLLTTKTGIPVSFSFIPGKEADVKSLERMLDGLKPEDTVYADAGYTNYKAEDRLHDEKFISLKTQRKSNSKRQDTTELRKEKKTIRKRIETTISDIKKLFPRTIHAVTFNGFLLKLILFIFAIQLNSILN
mgnify:CR=1 FL=1